MKKICELNSTLMTELPSAEKKGIFAIIIPDETMLYKAAQLADTENLAYITDLPAQTLEHLYVPEEPDAYIFTAKAFARFHPNKKSHITLRNIDTFYLIGLEHLFKENSAAIEYTLLTLKRLAHKPNILITTNHIDQSRRLHDFFKGWEFEYVTKKAEIAKVELGDGESSDSYVIESCRRHTKNAPGFIVCSNQAKAKVMHRQLHRKYGDALLVTEGNTADEIDTIAQSFNNKECITLVASAQIVEHLKIEPKTTYALPSTYTTKRRHYSNFIAQCYLMTAKDGQLHIAIDDEHMSPKKYLKNFYDYTPTYYELEIHRHQNLTALQNITSYVLDNPQGIIRKTIDSRFRSAFCFTKKNKSIDVCLTRLIRANIITQTNFDEGELRGYQGTQKWKTLSNLAGHPLKAAAVDEILRTTSMDKTLEKHPGTFSIVDMLLLHFLANPDDILLKASAQNEKIAHHFHNNSARSYFYLCYAAQSKEGKAAFAESMVSRVYKYEKYQPDIPPGDLFLKAMAMAYIFNERLYGEDLATCNTALTFPLTEDIDNRIRNSLINFGRLHNQLLENRQKDNRLIVIMRKTLHTIIICASYLTDIPGSFYPQVRPLHTPPLLPSEVHEFAEALNVDDMYNTRLLTEEEVSKAELPKRVKGKVMALLFYREI